MLICKNTHFRQSFFSTRKSQASKTQTTFPTPKSSFLFCIKQLRFFRTESVRYSSSWWQDLSSPANLLASHLRVRQFTEAPRVLPNKRGHSSLFSSTLCPLLSTTFNFATAFWGRISTRSPWNKTRTQMSSDWVKSGWMSLCSVYKWMTSLTVLSRLV